MAKFKVTATLTTTSVITKVIEAKNLHEATIHILKQAKMNE
jgi:hypothetical protein